jgi:hypothetical protein
MPWEDLGSVLLRPEWQFFNFRISAQTIKLSHSYSYRPIGYCLIGQVFDLIPVETFGVFKVYPTEEEQIKIMRIPQDFLDSGISFRWIGVKLSPRTLFYNPPDWRLELEYWV